MSAMISRTAHGFVRFRVIVLKVIHLWLSWQEEVIGDAKAVSTVTRSVVLLLAITFLLVVRY